MENEIKAKKRRSPKAKKTKESGRYGKQTIAVIVIMVIVIGLAIYSAFYRYGYVTYMTVFLFGVFLFLMGLILLIPLIIFWKEQPRKNKNGAKLHVWCLRTLQHICVALGSAAIYLIAITIPTTSKFSITFYVYGILSIISTYFGNKHYIRYYQRNRLVYPQAKEVGFKMFFTAITLFLIIGGGRVGFDCILDIPHLGNPKEVILYDVAIKYESGTGRSIGYYQIQGRDIHGKKQTFKLGHMAIEDIKEKNSSYLDITYLPNTNIVLKAK